MRVTNIERQTKQTKTPPREVSTPANSNQTLSRGNVIAMRRKQSDTVDENPFYETQSEAFTKQYDPTNRYANNDNSQISHVERTYALANDNPVVSQPSQSFAARKRVNHKNSAAYKAGKLWARTRVSAANTWINAWVLFWYLSFQVPMALISAVGIGMTVYVYNYIADIPGGQTLLALGGAAIELIGDLAASTRDIIMFVTNHFFGYPIDPILFFVAPFAVLFFLGLIQLLICAFIYYSMGLRCLTGQSAGLKQFTFVLALIGIVIPYLNLFPLILLWTTVVWLKPR